MIVIRDITVAFGPVRPLDGLDGALTAPIVGLIGPNGAGKTTLLNVLSGFVKPASGTISLDGTVIDQLSPVQRVALGIRRTFQKEQVVDDLSAMENVCAIADHTVRGDAGEAVRQALSFVGLWERRHVVGRRLNLFERRLVEIAKTVVGRPKAILLDEPGAGFDETEVGRLREILLAIPERFAVQVVLIDHDAALIAAVCSQTMVLDFGKRLALGPTRAVLDDPAVRRAYLGTA